MKKIAAILLALCVMLAFASCDGQTQTTSSEATSVTSDGTSTDASIEDVSSMSDETKPSALPGVIGGDGFGNALATAQKVTITNPVIDHEAVGKFNGDPEIRYFEGKYYIYSTISRSDRKQTNMDVYVSEDLANWELVENIINMADFPQTTGCIWAPSVIKHGDYYYLSFSINDIQSDSKNAGLMMARSTSPEGPFVKYFDGPLIGRYIYGAQPIDANFFEDEDGKIYFYYGGHANCNVGILNDTMDGFIPFEEYAEGDTQKQKDEKCFISLTKSGDMNAYVEGSFMIKRGDTYYLMWSVGSYVNSTYGVEYATGDNPLGPFTFRSKILKTDPSIASGPGHHSCIYIPEQDRWLICYHRRHVDAVTGTDRRICIDVMEFDENDLIKPIQMTFAWVLGGTDEDKVLSDPRIPVAPTHDESEYIEKYATASASFTKLNGMLAKLNDGNDNPDNRWTEHTNSADTCAYVEYDFGKQVTVKSIEIKWYEDKSELWAPSALSVYAYNESTGTWNELTLLGDVTFSPNVYNEYDFADVTTSKIKIQPTRTSGNRRFVGINEFKVIGTI